MPHLKKRHEKTYWDEWQHTDAPRTYSTASERAARFATFAKNFARIEAHNAQGKSFKLGINEFADMEPEEFATSHFGMKEGTRAWSGLPYLGRDPRLGGTPLLSFMRLLACL